MLPGCSRSYDDTLLWRELSILKEKVRLLDLSCRSIGSVVEELDAVVSSLGEGDGIVSVSPLYDDGRETGCLITFRNSPPVAILNGRDGVSPMLEYHDDGDAVVLVFADGTTFRLEKAAGETVVETSEVLSARKDSLSPRETWELDGFPLYLKKGLVINFNANLVSFDTLCIGKGYGQYRGRWLEIDSADVVVRKYEKGFASVASAPHGLTPSSEFSLLACGLSDGSLRISLSSGGKTFSTVLPSWGYEANGSVFVRCGAGTELNSLRLSVSDRDFDLPVWVFGDSYVSMSPNRWPWVLRERGVFDFLLDGLAGAGSGRMVQDLERALAFGTPEYLLWCLGMNDGAEWFPMHFAKVKDLCDRRGIRLIATTIPSIPSASKSEITAFLRSSGVRLVDFEAAVTDTVSGRWKEGLLDADGVHPTRAGAEALAAKVLEDFPEMLRLAISADR